MLINNFRKVVVSSISDCTEKNGVVTFLAILRQNTSVFLERGFTLEFVNFVDFPELSSKLKNQRTNELAFISRFLALFKNSFKALECLKQSFKRKLLESCFGAFLSFMVKLAIRGVVVSLRARSFEDDTSIHFYQDYFCAFFGCVIHKESSLKILLLHSGNDPLNQVFMTFKGLRDTFFERIVRREFKKTLGKMDAIVVLNKQLKKRLLAEIPGAEIVCIYNTSPFQKLYQEQFNRYFGLKRKFEIVAIGSLQYIKGFDLLILAIAKLEFKERSRLHITIVGDGPERKNLQNLIMSEGLFEHVTLAGQSSDVTLFLEFADAFILTSRDEGFPIALIEACSFGLPIISTCVGSVPEVFDDKSCLFIEANVDSIVAMLKCVLHGKIDLRELSHNSYTIFSEKLSLKNFLNSYLNLFINLAKRHAN